MADIIKTERAICTDCDNYLDDLEPAGRLGGDILCSGCMKKFLADSFTDALEWIHEAEIAPGRVFSVRYFAEERAAAPRGRETT